MESILGNPYLKPVVVGVVLIALFPLVAGYIVLAERKVLADLQTRLGPMRVGPYGFLQPIADALKLLLKEDIIPTAADKWLFWGAPVISTFAAMSALAVVPFSDKIYVADLNIGILYILAMSSVGVLGSILGGWSANSKYSLLGSLRSAAQMVSYEVPLGFTVVTALMVAGTLSMQEIIRGQFERGLWGFADNYGLMVVPTVVFLIAAVAETNRAPFDLPEAESELVAGFHTEYSGFRFALYFLAEYVSMFVISGVAVTMFFGGWLRPFPNVALLETPLNTAFPALLFAGIALGCILLVKKLVLRIQQIVLVGIAGLSLALAALFVVPAVNPYVIGLFWFFFKVAAILYTFIWYRGTFPRFRYDQLMNFGWRILIPISIGALIVNATVLLVAR